MELQIIIIFGIIVIAALLIPWFEGLIKNGWQLLIAAAAIGLAFSLRAGFMDYRSGDYNSFLAVWVEYFRENGGFAGLKHSIGNYNVPYLYFLAFFSYLPLNDLYLIKLLSISFDVVLAFGIMEIVGMFTNSAFKRLAAYLAVLLLPSVMINGAMWGQCDSIYTSFAVLALWFLLSDRPKFSMVCMALSLGFKLQAVFIMPLFLAALFAKKIKFSDYLIFPLTYLLLIMPAVISGRPFMDTLKLYFSQAHSIGTGLNYNSPSIFAIITGIKNTAAMSTVAVVCAFLYVFAILLWTWNKRNNLNNEVLLGIALLFVVGIPLLLPHMHDRYFFMSDVLALIPAVLYAGYIPSAVLASFASLICYYSYFNAEYLFPLRYGTFALIAVLLVFINFTAERISSNRNSFSNIKIFNFYVDKTAFSAIITLAPRFIAEAGYARVLEQVDRHV